NDGASGSRAARRRAALRRSAAEADVRVRAPRRAGDGGRQAPVKAPTGRRDDVTDDSDRRPRLAVTIGDVRGIGPEIIEKAAASREVREAADLVFVGPANAGVTVHEQTGTWRSGAPAADAGRFAGRAIERAVALALEGDVEG